MVAAEHCGCRSFYVSMMIQWDAFLSATSLIPALSQEFYPFAFAEFAGTAPPQGLF